MTLTEERHAIEARHPGWRVWLSDAGKPWATRLPDTSGQEATVGASHITQLDREIAEFEHQQMCLYRDATAARAYAHGMSAGLAGMVGA